MKSAVKRIIDATSSRKKYRQLSGVTAFVILLSSVLLMIFLMGLSDQMSYAKALAEYDEGKYGLALERFKQLGVIYALSDLLIH